MGFYQLRKEIKLKVSQEELWDFISSPNNLKEITPDYMGFDITTSDLPEKMYPGMIISYRVSPLFGIKMRWVTEITHVVPNQFFVDEQRIGPYAMWHHEHHIEPCEGGMKMTDIVSYSPPFGFLGTIAQNLFIRKQLEGIFDYREMVLKAKFGLIDS